MAVHSYDNIFLRIIEFAEIFLGEVNSPVYPSGNLGKFDFWTNFGKREANLRWNVPYSSKRITRCSRSPKFSCQFAVWHATLHPGAGHSSALFLSPHHSSSTSTHFFSLPLSRNLLLSVEYWRQFSQPHSPLFFYLWKIRFFPNFFPLGNIFFYLYFFVRFFFSIFSNISS